MRPITAIHLHHTTSSELATPAQVADYAVGRKVGITHDPYHFHVWRPPDSGPDLGVNLWRVSVGRHLNEIPASDRGHNEGAIAISVHGNYHAEPLPTFALVRLVECVAGLCRRFGLSADHVVGHRELPGASTLCPGYDPEVVRAAVRAVL